MKARCLVAVAGLLSLATASQAAVMTYKWAGDNPTNATVRIGERATLEVYVELDPDPPGPPPGPNDEMGLMLYVLAAFNYNDPPIDAIDCNGYGNPLEPGYTYTNICNPPPQPGLGFTGSEIRWQIEDQIKTFENTGGLPFLVSTVGVLGLPCTRPDGTDTDLFVENQSTDLAMFRRDLTTGVPLTDGTGFVSIHNTCTPEPGALALLAVGGLAALRRRR